MSCCELRHNYKEKIIGTGSENGKPFNFRAVIGKDGPNLARLGSCI